MMITLGFIFLLQLVDGQNFIDNPIKWCVISKAEFDKCQALSAELKYYHNDLVDTHKTLECIQRSTHDECMILIDQFQADVVNLDANEIFIAGRHHSLVPIMKEVYEGNREGYYSVAVLKKGGNMSHVNHIRDLKGSVGCFPSVSSMAGWTIPISVLIDKRAMEIIDCNNHVKSASTFFRGGCAVNILSNKYNPLGDNDQTLCSACGSERQGVRCSTQDPFAGYVGALNCLVTGGEVAFLKHNTIAHSIAHYNFSYSENDFELLCPDGGRAPVFDYARCNWGEVPSNAIATSSAKSNEEREALQMFFKMLSQHFGEKRTDPNFVSTFYLYESFPRYGQGYDLLVSDDTRRLVEVVSTQQNFQDYLNNRIMRHIETVRSCPVENMVLCVTSYAEYAKCLKMKIALDAQLLKPKMDCMNGNSQIGCMVAIQNREADISVFEAGDVYTAGLNYELIPVMAERYNLDSTSYYVVAVSQEDDTDTDVVFLKNRFTCHPSVMHGGGWVMPMAYLLNNELVRGYACDSVRAASEYFQKSCAPGALSSTFNFGLGHMNLCQLCRGSMSHYCSRDHNEPFYGFTGAFRCLVEGGGDIAFLKHTTVAENTNGRLKAWWARNTLDADFQLLCRDGTRASVSDYESCNLGKVRSNAVVTRGGYDRNVTEIHAYVNLLLYAQQLFGRDVVEEWNFQIFHSPEPFSDLIFSDATQQLIPLEEEEWHYHPYLGREFLNARYRVDCTASARALRVSVWTLFLVSLASVLYVGRF